jgi:hypothetical protein
MQKVRGPKKSFRKRSERTCLPLLNHGAASAQYWRKCIYDVYLLKFELLFPCLAKTYDVVSSNVTAKVRMSATERQILGGE